MSQQLSLFEAEAKTKFPPRPYQNQAIDNAFKAYDSGARGVMCRLPTGTGKTITAGLLADRWLQRSDKNRVVVLAHERQLVWQFAQEIHDVLGIEPRIEMADRRVGLYEDVPVVVASRQTLQERIVGGEQASRLYKFDAGLNWLVIVDEAHRYSHRMKSCKHIFDWFGANKNSWRFGITATPYRSDGASLEKLFPAIAVDYRLVDIDGGPCAVSDGWAVPYKQFFVRVEGVDFTKLKETAGDWNDDELEKVLSEQRRLAGFVEPTLDIVGDRRTLVFSPGVEMAKQVAAYINAKTGRMAARSLDGSVPDAVRRDVYRQHQTGEFQFLCVCGLCREGYNDPGIGAVAVFRPTKSRSLAEQMKGRGCRPMRGVIDGIKSADGRRAAIEASDKPNCIVVDLVGITGMADAASTASIYAQALPDEHAEAILSLANSKMIEASDGAVGSDVAAVVKQSREEFLAELAARKKKRLEQEERERLEYERRIKLGAEAKYSTREVEQGAGGAVVRKKDGTLVRMATLNQKNMIRARGIKFDESIMSFGMASRIIGQLMKGVPIEKIKRTNRLWNKATAPKPAAAQPVPDIPKADAAGVDFGEIFGATRNE